MLLRSLKAVNFRTTREVVVEDLPRRGVVALQAESEEDRRTWRDIIRFAFLGETTDGSRSSEDIILPGANYAFVQLSFTHPEAGVVSIRRGLDRSGTGPVSLSEGVKPLLNRRAEVEERLGEILGLSVEEFDRWYLGQVEMPEAEAVEPPGSAGEVEDLEALRREKKRIAGRLRRARKRLDKLEAGEEGEAEAELARLRDAMPREERAPRPEAPPDLRAEAEAAAAAFGRALRHDVSVASLTGKVRELEGVARHLKADRRRLGQVLLKLETEKRETLERLRRVNEFRDRHGELMSAMLAAGIGVDADLQGAESLGALGAELRRYDQGQEARRSLVLGLGLSAVGIVVLGIVFVATRTTEAPKWVYYLLGLVVFVDLVYAFRAFRKYEEASGRGGEGAAVGKSVDPVSMRESLEAEYADVIPGYEPGLPGKLKERLDGLDAQLREPEMRARRLDELLATLEREWKRANRECPEMPEGPEAESDDALPPLADEELRAMPERLNTLVDGILKLSVRAADAAAGGPLPLDDARAELAAALGRLAGACGVEESGEEVLLRAEAPDAADLAAIEDLRRQEGTISAYEKRLRKEIAAWRPAAPPAPGREAEVDAGAEEASRRVEELTTAVERIREVRERVSRNETDLAEVRVRIERATGAGDEGAAAEVPRPDADAGRSTVLVRVLAAIEGERGDHRPGPRFVLLPAEALPEGSSAAEILGLAEEVSSDLSQLVLAAPSGDAPEGAVVVGQGEA